MIDVFKRKSYNQLKYPIKKLSTLDAFKTYGLPWSFVWCEEDKAATIQISLMEKISVPTSNNIHS